MEIIGNGFIKDWNNPLNTQLWHRLEFSSSCDRTAVEPDAVSCLNWRLLCGALWHQAYTIKSMNKCIYLLNTFIHLFIDFTMTLLHFYNMFSKHGLSFFGGLSSLETSTSTCEQCYGWTWRCDWPYLVFVLLFLSQQWNHRVNELIVVIDPDVKQEIALITPLSLYQRRNWHCSISVKTILQKWFHSLVNNLHLKR